MYTDSYLGMDQQQDMKLDVKEAAAVPAEHPQWDLSDSDTDNNDQVRVVCIELHTKRGAAFI